MSKIEWTDQTWNMVTGCTKISPGCRGCYAETMHRRLMGIASQKEKYFRPFNDGAFPYEPALEEPFLVKKPIMFFSPSMSDLFHKQIPLAYIAKVWAVMYLNPQHTFQVLTKRADRLPELASESFNKLFLIYVHELIASHDYPHGLFAPRSIGELPLKNVWLGVSCEDQQRADERIPFLIKTPAAVRFLSCEPLIGPINLNRIAPFSCGAINSLSYHPISSPDKPFIDWVICGGESGRTARPMHPDWARSLREQCKAAGVPFFFKQWGEWLPYEPTSKSLPFYRNCASGKVYDGHGMNFINFENGEPGRWDGGQWMDGMDSIIFCEEIGSDECMFLKQGKHNTGNLLDGVQHLEYPKAVTA